MNYFGEDGPEVIRTPEQDASEAELEAMRAKSEYVKYFLVDFMEYNMRKVAAENAKFCAS
jgi:hypothetical protein